MFNEGTATQPTPSWQPGTGVIKAAPTPTGFVNAPPAPPLLDLAVPERTVKLRSGDKRFVHVFTPPTPEDWIEFERASRVRRIYRGDEIETVTKLREAALELWEKRELRVEGYPEAGLVPAEHRYQAVLGLSRVQPAEDQEDLGDTETSAVILEAWWNGEFFPRLVHRFKRPLIEHELRYKEASSRVSLIIERGRKSGKDAALESRQLPCLSTLMILYDELLVSTEGYTDSCGKIRPTIEAMDAAHKSAAIRQLFAEQAVTYDD
jgi:hypothetical protein